MRARVGSIAMVSAGVLLLGACSSQDKDQIKRLAMPEPITDRAPLTSELWDWAWLAAILVGILVWGLILYAAFKYRRRSEDEIPVQTRYNLPIEVLYTIVPVVMVVVFFYFTVQTQDGVLAQPAKTDHTVKVVGQKWSWTFNYLDEDAVGGKSVYTVGTPADFPTLVLPVGETVTLQLRSADVIHSFWVPSFLMKMDVVPGRDNSFSLTPTREGTFAGKCAELCGTYHSRMLFNLKVVSPEKYDEYLRGLEQQGNVGVASGGADVTTQTGLPQDTSQLGDQE